MRTPVITVVIPTYNHAHFLRGALQSVRAQSFTDWEAVIVNNYSDDDTIGVVESFADPRIHLENFRNNGVIAASRNRGIVLARGRYLAFLDSDDAWYPHKLARCMALLDSGADLVSHGLRRIGDEERDVFCGPERLATFDALLYGGNCITPSATVVRKDLVESVGMFSEDPEIVTAEDYHLWIKLAKADARMRFLREVLGEYRTHPGNQSAAVLRHLVAGLRVVQEFLPPSHSRGFTTRMRIRRRLAVAYYGAGRGMQINRQFAKAWPLFFRAATYWPFHLKTYAALALNAAGLSRLNH